MNIVAMVTFCALALAGCQTNQIDEIGQSDQIAQRCHAQGVKFNSSAMEKCSMTGGQKEHYSRRKNREHYQDKAADMFAGQGSVSQDNYRSAIAINANRSINCPSRPIGLGPYSPNC